MRLVKPKGLVSFENGLLLQKNLMEQCKSKGIDSIILLQHESVYTAGRRSNGFALTHPNGLAGIKVFDINRGGQITFHGPGQLVLYPIINLERFQKSLHWYVNNLERVLIDTCKSIGLNDAIGKESIGVWVNDEKIGFIGFHNSRWITSHGISLNVCPNLNFFNHIIPCGDPNMKITSISKLLGNHQSDSDLMSIIEHNMLQSFKNIFQCSLIEEEGWLG